MLHPLLLLLVIYNYVWYSGKLWRITAIYPDGTMKMITDSAITTIAYASDYNFYTDEENTSYMYQWLNEDFLDTLYNYENIIKTDYKWNVTSGDGKVSTKLAETTMVPAKVGLLNSYEYYKSYENLGDYSNGYLNVGYYWRLSNPYNSASSSDVWCVGSSGNALNNGPSSVSGLRPSINLKSNIKFSGNGTKSDPYRIVGDKENAIPNTTLLKTRSSGEYVKLENDSQNRVFRIVDTETINGNLTTKLVLNDYVKENGSVLEKAFSNGAFLWSSVSLSDTTYARGYLNTTWLSTLDTSKLEKGIYYLGQVDYGENYKSTVCSTVSSDVSVRDCIKNGTIVSNVSRDDYVGLLRYGEMFSSQPSIYTKDTASDMWLITPRSSSYVWYVVNFGYLHNTDPSNGRGLRPSINLKSTILIKSGSGLENDPFVVGFAS